MMFNPKLAFTPVPIPRVLLPGGDALLVGRGQRPGPPPPIDTLIGLASLRG